MRPKDLTFTTAMWYSSGAMQTSSTRATMVLWGALLAIVVLFAASLLAARRAGAGMLARANAPAIPPERVILDSSDLIIEGCITPLPSGEQEVRLKLYNTGLTALRDMRLEVALDGKPPKAPPSPITIRRFPRKATPEVVLLFDNTARRILSVKVDYRFGLLGSGAGSASASNLLPPCQSTPSQ
jgi:hypothetical protein